MAKKPEWSWQAVKDGVLGIYQVFLQNSDDLGQILLGLLFATLFTLAFLLFYPIIYLLQWLIYLLSPSSKEKNEEQK